MVGEDLVVPIDERGESADGKHAVGEASKQIIPFRVEGGILVAYQLVFEVIAHQLPPYRLTHQCDGATAAFAGLAVVPDPSRVQRKQPPDDGTEQNGDRADDGDEEADGECPEPGGRGDEFQQFNHARLKF